MLYFENEKAVLLYTQIRLIGTTISGTAFISEGLARQVLDAEEQFMKCKTTLCVIKVPGNV